ncbi:proteinrelated to microbial serine proteinase [Metarhizium robertsii ARSEF 23]|uniref:Proteinrelated to microbial serine proteinase n=1 Tax=Metarhizium robertsii (strain ARSEF 23 / ATCC MYA-3075) TaxID=655844 RepID=E9EM27_METRA|nr:proteinrelated to microbial serine proteinase [Metarhizium robertsii ARSEF 23]EFZ03998.2 proteinrelated to microbial serine proteinase [Metarhizium robertsii ARSEF 23]
MAKRIHLLCPRAQFFVLRLEDHYSDEAGCQITARGAAQAILVAMKKSVHIISMSWTIDPPEDENERRCLEAAIVKAVDENNLVFFSAGNKGAKQNATYSAKVTSRIFTIGAATASGAADERVNLDNINFTFPLSMVKLDDASMFNRKDLLGKKVANFLKEKFQKQLPVL